MRQRQFLLRDVGAAFLYRRASRGSSCSNSSINFRGCSHHSSHPRRVGGCGSPPRPLHTCRAVFTHLNFGLLYIGNTDFYNGRLDSDRYMSVMYKDPLPSDMGIMAGWDYLDDNSPTVELIPERNMETGIEEPARFSASSGLASCNANRQTAPISVF